MKRLLAIFAAITLVHAGSGRACAQLIVNGGFETGNFSGWNTSTGTTGNTTQLAVTSTSPHTGTYAAQFSGTSSSIDQNFTAVIGQSYVLTYFLKFDNSSSHTFGSFQAFWGGTPITGSSVTTNTPFGYTQYTFTQTATSTSQNVKFTGGTGSNSDHFFLDDVSVSPEPGSLPLLGILAAAGLAGYAWRRRRTEVRPAQALPPAGQ